MLKFLSQLRHEQPTFLWRHQPWSSSANFFQAVFGWKTNIEMGRTGTHWSFFSCFEVFNWNFNFEKHLIEKNASISKIWSVRQERIKPLRDWKDYFKAWAAFINPLKIQLRRRRLYWEKKIRECDSAWMVLWKKYQVYLLHLCSCVSCDHWHGIIKFFYYNPTSTGALLRSNTPDEKSRYQFPCKL